MAGISLVVFTAVIVTALVQVSQAAPSGAKPGQLLALAIDPRTRCCLRTFPVTPLKDIATLDACRAYCKKHKLIPIKIGNGQFACKRPTYACDEEKTGGDCAECYNKGTCYLMPYLGGVSTGVSTRASKLRQQISEVQRGNVNERASARRRTALGGEQFLASSTAGNHVTTQNGKRVLLTKTRSHHVTTDLARPGGLDAVKGVLPPGLTPEVLKRVGRAGSIKTTNTHQLESAVNDKLHAANSQTSSKTGFNQDLSTLAPGSKGKYHSRGHRTDTRAERNRERTSGKIRRSSQRTQLTGTAAGGAGAVELLNQREQKNLNRRGDSIVQTSSQGRLDQGLNKQHVDGGLSVQQTGTFSNQASTSKQSTGNIRGTSGVKQYASNNGLKRVTNDRETTRGTDLIRSGDVRRYNTVTKTKKHCKHCKHQNIEQVSGSSADTAVERIQHAGERRSKAELVGTRGGGATRLSSSSALNRFNRQAVKKHASDQKRRYAGASSALSITGQTQGRVSGSASQSTRRVVNESEEGVSADEQHALEKFGFPEKVHHR